MRLLYIGFLTLLVILTDPGQGSAETAPAP